MGLGGLYTDGLVTEDCFEASNLAAMEFTGGALWLGACLTDCGEALHPALVGLLGAEEEEEEEEEGGGGAGLTLAGACLGGWGDMLLTAGGEGGLLGTGEEEEEEEEEGPGDTGLEGVPDVFP